MNELKKEVRTKEETHAILDEYLNKASSIYHPSHYATGKYECIDVMQEIYGKEAVLIFCKLNAFKYLYRCARKNGEEDIEKAQNYLNMYARLKSEG